MNNKLKTLALGAALAIGVSGAAFAQSCPPGYYFSAGACYAGAAPGAYAPNNPLSAQSSAARSAPRAARCPERRTW